MVGHKRQRKDSLIRFSGVRQYQYFIGVVYAARLVDDHYYKFVIGERKNER